MTKTWLQGIIQPTTAHSVGAGVVVKFGGSLLTRSAWPDDLVALLTVLEAPLLVIGGGPVVDGLRAIDAACPRPAALMHHLSIEAMRLTARIVAEAIGLPIVDSVASLPTGPAILEAAVWLKSNSSGCQLPHSWQVTSDSIAATVAAAIQRDLLLAKSVPPPYLGFADCGTSLLPQDAMNDDRRTPRLFDRSATWEKSMEGFSKEQLALASLVAAGWVDPHFPGAAKSVTTIGWAAPAH